MNIVRTECPDPLPILGTNALNRLRDIKDMGKTIFGFFPCFYQFDGDKPIAFVQASNQLTDFVFWPENTE